MKSTQAHKTCYILHTCNSEQASHVPHSMYTIHGDAKNEIMTRTMRNYRHIARHDTTQVAQYDTDTGTHTCMGLLRIQKYTNTSGHSHRKILILYIHIHIVHGYVCCKNYMNTKRARVGNRVRQRNAVVKVYSSVAYWFKPIDGCGVKRRYKRNTHLGQCIIHQSQQPHISHHTIRNTQMCSTCLYFNKMASSLEI